MPHLHQPPHKGGWLFFCSEVVGNIPPFISWDSLDFCLRQGEYKKQSCPLKARLFLCEENFAIDYIVMIDSPKADEIFANVASVKLCVPPHQRLTSVSVLPTR